MTEFEFDWYNQDYINLQGKCWLPSPMPDAVICLIHGFGEHIGRYQHVAEFLAKYNFCLVAFDQRGHGQSEGDVGHTPCFSNLLDDAQQFLALIHEKFKSIPKILYGHSFGGNVAANLLINCQPDFIKGAIITSPWLKLAFEPPFYLQILGKIMNKVYPKYTVSGNLTLEELSNDPEVAKKYEKDELTHNSITARMYQEVVTNGIKAIKNAHQINYDLLVFHGTADKITSHKATEQFVKNINGDKVTFKLWEQAKHELHNEPNQDEVLTEICQWISEIIKK